MTRELKTRHGLGKIFAKHVSHKRLVSEYKDLSEKAVLLQMSETKKKSEFWQFCPRGLVS